MTFKIFVHYYDNLKNSPPPPPLSLLTSFLSMFVDNLFLATVYENNAITYSPDIFLLSEINDFMILTYKAILY